MADPRVPVDSDVSTFDGWAEGGMWLPGIQAAFTEAPQQRRSVKSAMQILAAAEEVLGAAGIQGLTMQGVAQVAGVSVGTIYGRFDGKIGLLSAVKDLLLTRMETDLTQRLPACTDLHGVVEEFVGCLADHLGRPAILAVTSSPEQSPEQLQRAVTTRMRMLQELEQAVDRYPRQVGHEDRHAALRVVVELVIGFLLTTTPRIGNYLGPSEHHRNELIRVCYLYLASPAERAFG